MAILAKTVILLCLGLLAFGERVNYSGHKVVTVIPKTNEELQFLHRLRNDYGVDLWNEPRFLNHSVMMRLEPSLADHVEEALAKNRVEHFTAFDDLQSVIDTEQVYNAPTNTTFSSGPFDFGKYHVLQEVDTFLTAVINTNPAIAKYEVAGKSYENRPIHLLRISSGGFGTKPAIMMECGIHAREWSSVAACLYFVNELITKYGEDSKITSIVDKYEFYIIPEANPDGYEYTWKQDRLWRKTRSHSSLDWLGVCRGADANRNFDIDHCGLGTSRKPCDEIFCGDKPFSESESRALKNLMEKIGSRMKAYFSLHAYSQLWMTPYGITKKLPSNYQELVRVANAGAEALRIKHGTQYEVGSIANIIYEAAGSSVDYAYEVLNIKMAFALELRDNGRYGFFLPAHLILPTCDETTDGLVAAILAL